MTATVHHMSSSSGLRKFQADGFFWTKCTYICCPKWTKKEYNIHYKLF